MSLCCDAVCGRGVWEGTVLLAWVLVELLVTSPTTHKQIGPFWCWFPGGWVCVHSRTLCVSPTNSPVRLGVSPTAATPTGFFSQRFWGFISLGWNSGLHGLSRSPVVPPTLSTCKCETARSSSQFLLPVWMNVFFFNYFIAGLPFNSIFWQFWLIFVFKCVVVLLLVVQGGKVYVSTCASSSLLRNSHERTC